MMTKSKRLNLLLAVVVTGIWGSIGYQLIGAIAEPHSEETSVVFLPIPFGEADSLYKYTPHARDPFVLNRKGKKPSPSRAKKEEPPWTPPPLRLVGIVGHGGKNTAIIEGSTGDIQFLKVNDTLSGVTILKIERPRVSYSYRKKTVDWVLDE